MENDKIRGNESGIELTRYSYADYRPLFDSYMTRMFGNYKQQISSKFDNIEDLHNMIESLMKMEQDSNGAFGSLPVSDDLKEINEQLKTVLDEIQTNQDAIILLAQKSIESDKHHITAVASMADSARGRWFNIIDAGGAREFSSPEGQEMFVCNKADLLNIVTDAYDNYNEVWNDHDKSEYIVYRDGVDLTVEEPGADKGYDGMEGDRDYE